MPSHIFPLIASRHFSTRNKVLAHSMQIWYKGPSPPTSINDSLQFELGKGGIDFDACSKSFETRLGRSSPSATFIGFLRTSFPNSLGTLVRGFSRATLVSSSGAELFLARRTGIVSPGSKAPSKIFENFDPQIPEKDSEMKQGLQANLRLQAGPRAKLVHAVTAQ